MAINVRYTFTFQGTEIGGFVLCEATKPVSPGRVTPRPSWWREMGIFPAANTTQSIITQYRRAFGNPIKGQQIQIRLTPITSDGQRARPVTGSCIVT